MSASEGYLEEVMGNAFQIDPASGSLKTNFAPKDFMKGYFSFKVQAEDTGKLFQNLVLLNKKLTGPSFYFQLRTSLRLM
jgi:hypothetical protein